MGMEKQNSSNQKRKRGGGNNFAQSKKEKKNPKALLDWSVSDVSAWLKSKDFGTGVVSHFIGMESKLIAKTLCFRDPMHIHFEVDNYTCTNSNPHLLSR